MTTEPLEFEPTTVPEWDADAELAGVLAGEDLVPPDEAEAKAMLKAMTISLPRDVDQVALIAYAAQRPTPLGLDLPPDSALFDFYQIELPLNILIASGPRLVHLRLRLELEATGADPSGEAVAYDLYPRDQSDVKTVLSGAVNLDVSKALKYVLPPAAAPLADCLGLKLDLPFKWTATYATVQTTDRMSNPVEWNVTDDEIQNGFTANVIIRAPKGAAVSVVATLTCELRKAGLLGKIFKEQLVSKARRYTITAG